MRQRAFCAGLVLLAACNAGADASKSSGLSVAVDSSGAVPVLTVSGNAQEWSLDSLAVIRAEPTVGFSRVRSIALDPRGGVWVADVGENRLSYHGDDGSWIEDRGRVGSGPGEFRRPYSLVMHDGGLLVHDVENSRVVRFALGAGADTSWLIPNRLTGDAMSVRFFPNPDGPLLADLSRDLVPPRLAYRRLGDDSLILAAVRDQTFDDSKVCPVGDAIRFFGSPFSPGPVMSPIGDGTVRTSSGDYHLEFFDRAGKPLRTVIRSASRDSVSQAEFDSATADWRKFSAENNAADCTGSLERYRFKPAIRALLPDADGRLWVEQRVPGRFVYEVWKGDSLLAHLPAPERVAGIPPAILGDKLAVVAESPDDGYEVRLYRIIPAPSRTAPTRSP